MGTADRPADQVTLLTRRRVVLALVCSGLAAVVIFTAARSSNSKDEPRTGVPTDADARGVLAAAYQRATRTADAHAFCEASEVRAICINQYNDRGGRGAVPSEAPRILDSLTIGVARVLTVCGVDGRGETYRADFPVQRKADGSLMALLDVFWDSKTYSGNRADGVPVPVSPGPQKFSC